MPYREECSDCKGNDYRVAIICNQCGSAKPSKIISICSRCKAESDSGKPHLLTTNSIDIRKFQSDTPEKHTYMDLCDKCKDELDAMIKSFMNIDADIAKKKKQHE